MDIDWRWLAGLAVTSLLAVMSHLRARLVKLEARVERYEVERSEPFPSDDTDEARAIADAKALEKKFGKRLTFAQAYRVVKAVRDAKKAKGSCKDDGIDEGNGSKHSA